MTRIITLLISVYAVSCSPCMDVFGGEVDVTILYKEKETAAWWSNGIVKTNKDEYKITIDDSTDDDDCAITIGEQTYPVQLTKITSGWLGLSKTTNSNIQLVSTQHSVDISISYKDGTTAHITGERLYNGRKKSVSGEGMNIQSVAVAIMLSFIMFRVMGTKSR